MSRLTGADALGLYRAYQAVYTPQELTEEQVWEGVEEWVNALLEEGYDLSDYTWEEMYEAYLEEIYGTGLGGNTKTKPNRLDTAVGNAVKSVTSSGADATPRTTGIYGQPTRKPTPAATPTTPTKSATPAAPTQSRFAGARDAAFAKAQNIKGSPVVGSKPAASSPAASAAASRPAAGAPARPTATAAAPKPAAGAPAKPTGPAVGMLGKTSFEIRTPTSAELKAAQASRAGGEKNPEKVLQAAKAASTPKPTATSTPSVGQKASGLSLGSSQFKPTTPAAKPAAFSPTPAVTPAAKPTPTSKPTPAATGSKKPGSIVSSFDYFDVVKGYLIGEGYADTEEAALAIMINMSEEWRQSIIKSI